MEDHARDVLGLLDALGLERVVMGGHSFGGLLTYWLAANHPERVERCIVLDAPARSTRSVVEQIKPSLARLGEVYASWDEYLAFVQAMPYFRRRRTGSPRSRATSGPTCRSARTGRCRRARGQRRSRRPSRARSTVDWPATVARVAQPTLLLRAPGDFGPPGSPPDLSRVNAERTVALLADGQLVEGVGNHLTFMFGEGARVLTEHIAHFLARVPAS